MTDFDREHHMYDSELFESHFHDLSSSYGTVEFQIRFSNDAIAIVFAKNREEKQNNKYYDRQFN